MTSPENQRNTFRALSTSLQLHQGGDGRTKMRPGILRPEKARNIVCAQNSIGKMYMARCSLLFLTS